MLKVNIFEMPSLYRTPLTVSGFRFGDGEKSACIVGSLRGNEVQQMYICSQLVRALKAIEEDGGINPDRTVEVIPCANPYSINIEKRFWAMDDTDINRMFPGYDQGETTQRIADGIFRHLQGWKHGVHFTSFYMRGDFMPHVRMLQTDYADPDLATLFGLPFVILRAPSPIDTTTLNYNWQIWNTKAFTIYTRGNQKLDIPSANTAIHGVLRFLKRTGVITCKIDGGSVPTVMREKQLEPVHSRAAGIYTRLKRPGDMVRENELIGQIIDPLTGEVLQNVRSHVNGTVFFSFREALVMERQILFQVIPDLIYS